MKKAIALFVFLLGATYLGFSQEKNNVNHLTSGKWHVKSMNFGDEKLELSKGKHWMVFNKNGVYKIMLDNQEQIGTWQLDEAKQIKFDAENFLGNSKIEKLTAKEFLFSISQGNVVCKMTLEKES